MRKTKPSDRKPSVFIKFDKKKDFLYRQASIIIEQITGQNRAGSVKTLCYASPYNNKAALLGLVTETLKNYKILTEVTQKAGLSARGVSLGLWCVLLRDHFAGKLECGSALAEMIARSKARLHAEWVKARLRYGDVVEQPAVQKYARLNTLKPIIFDPASLDLVRDDLMPWLYRCGPGFRLNDPLVQTGHLIIQDRASCLPPFILAPQPGDHVIDCCAAPGNKTTLLAALMSNTGSICAFERDPKRYKLLCAMLDRAGCTNSVTARQADFLTIRPQDYPHVTMIMVDPSCSGSGMTHLSLERSFDNSTNDHSEEGTDLDRLEKLSNFQTMIVEHAMRFPGCSRITYSTCSIHEVENESVVRRVLANNPQWMLGDALPGWHRRGVGTGGEKMVRVDPKLDASHGFFVALFVRK